uniref:Uncharacterized protein n=1 Tax=Rangifer tarandus platyrhynchus TaxID=3082113 RepID=A0ACB0F6C2_RANTA|nr:unnamed protein product [Rangifer tarandus platyrhynchus]
MEEDVPRREGVGPEGRALFTITPGWQHTGGQAEAARGARGGCLGSCASPISTPAGLYFPPPGRRGARTAGRAQDASVQNPLFRNSTRMPREAGGGPASDPSLPPQYKDGGCGRSAHVRVESGLGRGETALVPVPPRRRRCRGGSRRLPCSCCCAFAAGKQH